LGLISIKQKMISIIYYQKNKNLYVIVKIISDTKGSGQVILKQILNIGTIENPMMIC